MTPEEMAVPARVQIGSHRAEIEALQKRIDENGPVNLVAIEEYEKPSNAPISQQAA